MSEFRKFYDSSFGVTDVESFISGSFPEWSKYETRERLRAGTRAVIDRAKGLQSPLLLDVGCGDGVALRRFQKSGASFRLIGLDISLVALKKAKTWGTRAELIVCDSNYLPFSESVFDFVFCTEVLEHVLEPEELSKELSRVCKNTLVLTTPCFGPNSSSRYDKWASIWNDYIRKLAAEKGIEAMLEMTPNLAGSTMHTGHVNVFTTSLLKTVVGKYFRSTETKGIFFSLPLLSKIFDVKPRLEGLHRILQISILQHVPLFCTFIGKYGAIGNFEILLICTK